MFKETAGNLGSLAETPEGAKLAGLEITLTPPDPLRPFHLGKLLLAKVEMGEVLLRKLASEKHETYDCFTTGHDQKTSYSVMLLIQEE
jgi:hypothetical protein